MAANLENTGANPTELLLNRMLEMLVWAKLVKWWVSIRREVTVYTCVLICVIMVELEFSDPVEEAIRDVRSDETPNNWFVMMVL